MAKAKRSETDGDTVRAAELYTKALAANPRLTAALVGRGKLRFAQGDPDAALSDFAKAREIDAASVSPTDEAQALNARAMQYLSEKKYSDAVDDFEAAEKLAASVVNLPEMAQAYLQRGRARQENRMHDGAMADFAAVIDKSPKLARDAYVRRAECRLETGDAQGAAEDAAAAIKADPEFAEAYFVRGRIKLAGQDNVGAAADFARAAELRTDLLKDPDRARLAGGAHFAAAKDLLASKDFDKALFEFERAALLDPEGTLGYKTNPDFVSAYVQRAARSRAAGKLDEAIADCNRAIKEHPKFASAAHSERGECYFELGKRADAINDLTTAISLDRQNDLAYSRLGYAQMQLEEYPEALKNLDEAIRLKNDYVDRFNRAVVLSALRRFPEAEKEFSELVVERPADADAYYQRAIVALDLQNYARATADLREARKLLETAAGTDESVKEVVQGKLGDTLALLGWVLACQPGSDRKSADEAVQAITKACVNSNWSIPWHIDALAAAYASQGDFGKAKEWQLQATKKAANGEATPPLAPDRKALEALYSAEKPFRLPGGAAPSTPSDRPESDSKLKTGEVGSSKVPAAKSPVNQPPVSSKQVQEEAEQRLQKLKPNPPPK